MGEMLSVVVPVHNEAGFLPSALPRLVSEINRLGQDWELVVVENGSIDDTAGTALRLIEDLAAPGRVISLPDPDYGAALREGLREAKGDAVVMFDIDYFSGDFAAKALADGADIVIASKRAEGSEDRRSALRRTGTWGFNLLLRTLFSSAVGDTHGMKLFRRPVLDALLDAVTRTKDLFDTELVLRAERAGYRISELPVIVKEERDAKSSFVKRIPRTLRGLSALRRTFADEARREL